MFSEEDGVKYCVDQCPQLYIVDSSNKYYKRCTSECPGHYSASDQGECVWRISKGALAGCIGACVAVVLAVGIAILVLAVKRHQRKAAGRKTLRT